MTAGSFIRNEHERVVVTTGAFEVVACASGMDLMGIESHLPIVSVRNDPSDSSAVRLLPAREPLTRIG